MTSPPVDGPHATPAEHVVALRRLVAALNEFLDAGATSLDDEWDDPDCDAVNAGGTVHNAVCEVEKFYGANKLPSPDARNPWRDLLHSCRNEADEIKRQNESHEQATKLCDWAESEIEAVSQPVVETPFSDTSDVVTSATILVKKPKRSTERGEGQAKLIAALTKHHEYADGSCLNTAYIGNNELALLANVSNSTASEFFKKEFGGHTKYKNVYCSDIHLLTAALKKLNDEYVVDDLFGGSPPGEDDRDDDE